MATLEEQRLLNNIRVHAPGALDNVIKLELFNVCDEFFVETNMWAEDVPFTASPGIKEYLFENEGASRVHRLEYVKPASEDRFVQATLLEGGRVVLRDDVNVATAMIARLILSVRDPVDGEDMPQFPTWIMQRYFHLLVEGTVARLMGQPAKPYSNERLSVYHARKFRNMMAVARGDARKVNIYDGQRWRFPRTFR